MIKVQCQCGKSFEISKNECICECPYCDSIGLLFDPKQPLYKSEDVVNDFEGKIVRAIWMGLFDYKGPKL